VPQNKEDWPSVEAILQFEGRVRQRLLKLYDEIESGAVKLTRKHARVLFLTFEHEAMHAETLLYMLIQRAGTGTLPPPGFTAPHWESLSQAWDAAPALGQRTVTLGGETISLGHEDDESADDEATVDEIKAHEFGWDNEHPKRECEVKPFRIDWRPVSNGDFYKFYRGEGSGKVELPASWTEEDGVVQVIAHIRALLSPIG
jgi:L-histidine Nalpha-methyltransferase / hercynylcysteine S-oxide synthase